MALCWRAQVQGLRFGFAPDATVLYRRRKSEWARMRAVVDTGAVVPGVGFPVSSVSAPRLRPSLRHSDESSTEAVRPRDEAPTTLAPHE